MTQSVFDHIFHGLPPGDALEEMRPSNVNKTPFLRQLLVDRALDAFDSPSVFENADFPASFRAPFQVPYVFEDRPTPAIIKQPFGLTGGMDLLFVSDGHFLPVKFQVTPVYRNSPNTFKAVTQPDVMYVGWRPGYYRVLYHGLDLWGSHAPYVDFQEKLERLSVQFDQQFKQILPAELSLDAFSDPSHLLRQPRPNFKFDLFQELQETLRQSPVSKYLIPFGSQFPAPLDSA